MRVYAVPPPQYSVCGMTDGLAPCVCHFPEGEAATGLGCLVSESAVCALHCTLPVRLPGCGCTLSYMPSKAPVGCWMFGVDRKAA